MAVARAVAVVAAALMLAGCAAAAPPLPPGPTDAEAQALADQVQERAWENFTNRYAGEVDLARPQVKVVEYIHEGEYVEQMTKCLVAAGVNATFDRAGVSAEPGPGQLAGDVAYAQYVCSLEYPVHPEEQGFLSRAQLEYMYDFYTTRLSPCLRLMGYPVSSAPPRSAFVEGYEENLYFGWIPYYDVQPYVHNDREWEEIDTRCGALPDPFPHFR
ncbi:MAG: hypothetical protein ABJB03_02535 [Rhodoglobus sp.]